jgi:hypothetical protein
MKKKNKETLSTQLFIGLVVFCGISFGLGYYSTPSSETKKSMLAHTEYLSMTNETQIALQIEMWLHFL